jgi:hypothetical protein
MARYTITARNSAGPVEFHERMTIDAALNKAAELRAAEFHSITLINLETGLEIKDLERLITNRVGAS